MDAFGQTFAQFKSLFDKMSSSQRLTLLLLPILVLGAFSFVYFQKGYSSYTALSSGKVFTTSEIAVAEQSLIQEGLRDFKKIGLQLHAPSSQVDRYNSVLLKSGSLPTNWAEELEATYDKMGMFASSKQRQLYQETAIGKQLSRMLKVFPSIKDAQVVWTKPVKSGWRHDSVQKTATVSVVPNSGHEVTQHLAGVIRAAVASSLSGMMPENVVVIDQINQNTFEPETAAQKLSSQLQKEQNRVAETFKAKIISGLDYIDDLRVSVNVKINDTASEFETSEKLDTASVVPILEETNKEEHASSQAASEPGVKSNTGGSVEVESGKKTSSSVTNTRIENVPSRVITQSKKSPGRIESVTASVMVPETYYAAVAVVNLTKQGEVQGETKEEQDAFKVKVEEEQLKVQTEVEKNVLNHVGKALGLKKEEAELNVNVSSYIPVPRDEVVVSEPITGMAFDLVRQWGGVAALAICAIFAYRMLVKNIPQLEAGPEIDIQAMLQPPVQTTMPQFEEEELEAPVRVVETDDRSRDELQGTVRENPEMAASVISQWMKSAS